MKKVFIAIVKFLYFITGLKALKSALESFVFRYSLRVRMVPISFKWFIWTIGVLSGASGMYVHFTVPELITAIAEASTSKTYTNPSITIEKPVEVKNEATGRTIEELAHYIWTKESTNGKNNYSKCEAIGKINGIGYAIPGDGTYVCFDSHEDEMTALHGWLTVRKAYGWSELKMLCTYSGSHYAECDAIKK